MRTTSIGNQGEQLAAEALVREGYEIIDRNWKTRASEIDIIAARGGSMYFIEVKYRASARQGDGLDYITDQKLSHMRRAAETWVSIYNWQGEYALLAVAVSGIGNEADIREIA